MCCDNDDGFWCLGGVEAEDFGDAVAEGGDDVGVGGVVEDGEGAAAVGEG